MLWVLKRIPSKEYPQHISMPKKNKMLNSHYSILKVCLFVPRSGTPRAWLDRNWFRILHLKKKNEISWRLCKFWVSSSKSVNNSQFVGDCNEGESIHLQGMQLCQTFCRWWKLGSMLKQKKREFSSAEKSVDLFLEGAKTTRCIHSL